MNVLVNLIFFLTITLTPNMIEKNDDDDDDDEDDDDDDDDGDDNDKEF